MSDVNYLIGSDAVADQPLPVYSEEAVSFLSDLSAELLRVPNVRSYPDVVSVAFWCRKANLLRKRKACTDAAHRLGRGLAFHVTPGNIPVNFAFSYFFALLAGNASIVRVPSKPFAQIEMICGAMKRILPQHPEIERRTAFVTYPSSDADATAAFCARADVRIIWGGDRTVAEVRRHPAKPRCIDVTFPDRYSLCLLDGEAVNHADDGTLSHLAESFYNDTYLMDQNACSSPQLILWQNADEASKTRFWDAVVRVTKERYELQGMTAVDKYTQLCEDAIEHAEVRRVLRQEGNLLYRAQLDSLPAEATELRGKGGYFYEYDLRSLDELCGIVNEKYQTLTYFGVDAQQVRELVLQKRLRGIDRIVPVGAAMDIDIVWDGYDLVRVLSRVVVSK